MTPLKPLTSRGHVQGAIAGVSVLLLAVALLRTPLGQGGLDAISRSDGEPMAATAGFLAAAWLTAAAFGTWFGTPPDGLPVAGPPAAALTTGVTAALLAPLTVVIGGMAAAGPAKALLATLGLEVAVLAGCLLGWVALRWEPVATALSAALLGLLLTLAVRFTLIASFVPGPAIHPDGMVTGATLDALRSQDRWIPIATGVSVALANTVAALDAGRTRGLLLLAVGPLAVRAAAAGLGMIWADTSVLAYTRPREWFFLLLGGVVGALTGLAVPGRSTRRLRSRLTAPHHHPV